MSEKVAQETHYLDLTKFGEGHENVNPEDQLLACPFCGGLELARCWDDGLYWIRCTSCGATGPETTKYSGEEGDPYVDWNSRPWEDQLKKHCADLQHDLDECIRQCNEEHAS